MEKMQVKPFYQMRVKKRLQSKVVSVGRGQQRKFIFVEVLSSSGTERKRRRKVVNFTEAYEVFEKKKKKKPWLNWKSTAAVLLTAFTNEKKKECT
jgi:hypothetical protein